MKLSKIVCSILALGFILMLPSCEWLKDLTGNGDDSDDPILCTEEFRTVGLEITGAELDNFFTIRKETNDTLEIASEPFLSIYPVLDDNFQDELEGKEEEFIFLGFIGEEEVVRESFVIKADKCHIEKVSGPESVSL